MEQIKFPCEACGAGLQFAPGTTVLKCAYCGHENPIPQVAAAAIEELDYHAALQAAAQDQPVIERPTVKCGNCAAEFTFDANVTAEDCPFCGTPLVLKETHNSAVLKPRSLLPFALTEQQARERFAAWLSGLWFAPNKVKRYARQNRGLTGMYVPYWTYDCATTSAYTGQRGEHYYVTETYTAYENGKPVQRTRQVRHTRWYPAAGTVYRDFDDVLILASTSLPQTQAERLEPWDLASLVPYSEEYLSGFRAEAYHVDVEQGFEKAKAIMDALIRGDVRRDIGGDEQRIHRVQTRHDRITFKHVLLPVYLAAYRFKDKAYRFVVNARTGEVQGERPYSWVKIALLVLVIGLLSLLGLQFMGEAR
jgi:DNA-directed RNA polymerase subunit RPC12/RpoP